MRTHRIALLGGDGIGPEVVEAALPALETAASIWDFRLETEYFPWGTDYYLEHGVMMPADGLVQLEGFSAIFLGAVGYPAKVPDHITLHGLLLAIRQGFRQFINMRPHRILPGVQSPLREASFDILTIRENSEGEYVGAGGRAHHGTDNEVAVETSIFTRQGVERVMRFAFEQAGERSGKLAACTKSNAMRHIMVFWDEVFEELSAQYPTVTGTRYHVDALAARYITHPESLDVVVASNLFGDILTDVGAAIQGGLGFAASANIDPTRRYPSMFEPVHGSAPDIAGKGVANPSATIWTGALMLGFLGEKQAADAVMKGLEKVTRAGQVTTPDMGGNATTEQMGDAVARAIRNSTE